MRKSSLPAGLLALFVAAALAAQQPPAPASGSGFDSDSCMKHCKEMAESHQKMMDSQKAMKEKHEAAWKEIEAQLETAKKARGEKKVAALESAVEKLVAFHNEMQRSMNEGAGMMGGMEGHHPGMGHEMGMMGHGMMDCPCCQGGTPPAAHKH